LVPGLRVSEQAAPSQSASEILITTVDSPALVAQTMMPSAASDIPQIWTPDAPYTQEDVETALKAFREAGEYPPEELIAAVRAFLRNAVMAAIIGQDYDEAATLKGMELRLSREEVDQMKHLEDQKLRVRSIEERMTAVADKLAEIRASWSERLEAFEAEKMCKLEEMRAKQEQERKEFEAHWNNPMTLLAFSKPSAQLMLIRKQQRLSALANEFMRAKDLKRRGDELERLETAEAERRASASMRTVFQHLKNRHEKELAHAQMNWQRQWQTLEAERDAEIEQTELVLRQLELRRAECMTSRLRVVPSVCRPDSGMASTSPRTRKKLAKFKNTNQQGKLAIMGFKLGGARGKRTEQPRKRRISCRGSEF
jgi:hypothetical protein